MGGRTLLPLQLPQLLAGDVLLLSLYGDMLVNGALVPGHDPRPGFAVCLGHGLVVDGDSADLRRLKDEILALFDLTDHGTAVSADVVLNTGLVVVSASAGQDAVCDGVIAAPPLPCPSTRVAGGSRWCLSVLD